jgi:hypothetical protein
MTQHTEESLMTLADEWYEAGEFSERRENREFLQLAIREVLAERDALQRDRDCLKRLYDAEKPLHERRTMPSPAFPDDPEYQPPYMFQASFWTSGCRCVECHALHVGEQQYVRAEKAEAERDALAMQVKLKPAPMADCPVYCKTAVDLQAECERLRKDADRYAGVRKIFLHGRDFVTVKMKGVRTADDVDAAIDAAMKEQP